MCVIIVLYRNNYLLQREITSGMKVSPAKMNAGFDHDWQTLMNNVHVDHKKY